MPQPLTSDAGADVVIVGAGIAGVSTAFHVLARTSKRVLLIERDLLAHGATGRNAGQLATYFERPLCDLVDEYGLAPVISAQREVDEAWGVLQSMLDAAGGSAHVEPCVGHMGMLNLNHVLVHLRNLSIRRQGGLEYDRCVLSDAAPFLDEIPADYAGLYRIVPPDTIRELLQVDDERYLAVLSGGKGCANGALACHDVVGYLERTYPDRFRFVDHTTVDHIVLETDHADVRAGAHVLRARHVVLCTNGYVDHVVENRTGPEVWASHGDVVRGTVGYMAAVRERQWRPPSAYSFIRNEHIGDGAIPYVYVTTRSHEMDGAVASLVCAGGPEAPLPDGYRADDDVPASVVAQFDSDVRPLAFPGRPPGAGFEYAWHGLMGYTQTQVRVVGFEPANPVLLYNLGCNGVGFLPSVAGGLRIARLLAGEVLGPTIFDPPACVS